MLEALKSCELLGLMIDCLLLICLTTYPNVDQRFVSRGLEHSFGGAALFVSCPMRSQP